MAHKHVEIISLFGLIDPFALEPLLQHVSSSHARIREGIHRIVSPSYLTCHTSIHFLSFVKIQVE